MNNKKDNLGNSDGLSKRLIDMTCEELVHHIKKAMTETAITSEAESDKPKHLLRGYKELASFLKCSVSTAFRKVASRDIHHPAVIQSGRTILFDANLVLEQLQQLSEDSFIHERRKRIKATI